MTIGTFYLWIIATDLAIALAIWKAVSWIL